MDRDPGRIEPSGSGDQPSDSGSPQSEEDRLHLLHRLEQFSGPLPHPETLQRYEEILPGCAEALVDAFLQEGKHRRALEEEVARSDRRRSWAGLVLGFLVAAGGLVAATLVAIYAHPAAGAVLGTVDIVSLVWVFVVGSKGATRGEEADAG